MIERVYVTQSGYHSLLKRKDELVEQLRSSQFDKGKAAAGDSNSWHDNAEYDMHARNELMIAEQVAAMISQIEKVQIVELPSENKTVAVGHIVTLERSDGETKTYEVGGFEETDLRLSPKRLSYDAPILREFFGKPVGHRSLVQIGERVDELVLIDIRLG
jgi:transcription elongation GreA/GreB family factor